jgi:hypothetical protein
MLYKHHKHSTEKCFILENGTLTNQKINMNSDTNMSLNSGAWSPSHSHRGGLVAVQTDMENLRRHRHMPGDPQIDTEVDVEILTQTQMWTWIPSHRHRHGLGDPHTDIDMH